MALITPKRDFFVVLYVSNINIGVCNRSSSVGVLGWHILALLIPCDDAMFPGTIHLLLTNSGYCCCSFLTLTLVKKSRVRDHTKVLEP